MDSLHRTDRPAGRALAAYRSYRTCARGTALLALIVLAGLVMLSLATPAARASPAASPAGLTVKMSVGSQQLDEYRSTNIILILANSGAPRIVTNVLLIAPSFAQITYSGHRLPRAHGRTRYSVSRPIGENDQYALVFGISIVGPLQPGKSLLVAEVTSRPAGDPAPSTVVASASMTFEVLGESAFLSAVGLPSLLLVPGLVFAVVLWLLVRRAYPAGHGTAAGLSGLPGVEDKVVFWVLAIPVGIALTFAYAPLTALLGEPRDILTAYGLDDILAIWMLAALAGFVAWAVLWIAPMTSRRIWRRLYVPQAGDDALRVLRKLSRRALLPGRRPASLRRPRGRWTSPGQAPLPVCVLGQSGGRCLISVPIVYAPPNPAIDKARTADDARAVMRAIVRARDTVHIRYASTQAPVLVDSAAVQVTAADQVVSIIEGE